MAQALDIRTQTRTQDTRVIGLVSGSHFVSHFYILLLPPLFPFVRAEYGVNYTELGLALKVGRQKAESMRGEPMPIARRKIAAALQRRGFSWEVTARVLEILLAPGEEEES